MPKSPSPCLQLEGSLHLLINYTTSSPLSPLHHFSILSTPHKHTADTHQISMTQLPKNNTPDVEAKWLALRQKHLEDSNKFQRDAVRKRTEFESRVEKGRKALLDKHMNEESEFWSKHGKASGAAKGAPKSARTQPPVSARASAIVPRKYPTPAADNSSSRPAVPRYEAGPPTTPSQASQSAKSPQVPTTPKEQPRRRLQKSGKSEVIDLCSSDDEKEPPTKKTPVIPKTVAPCPVQEQPIVQEADAQEIVSPRQVHISTGFVIPEATLELFGRSAAHCTVSFCHTIIQLYTC
jgi:hypothetical protein